LLDRVAGTTKVDVVDGMRNCEDGEE
jgi:hypothetical protein